MIPLQNILKASLQDVLKMSWTRLSDLLKMFSKRLEDALARRLEEVLKTFWKRLEDVLKTYGQDEYIGLDQDVFWRQRTKANIFVLIKTSWRCLQDVFIKTYVCWEWYQITQSITNILVDTGRKLNVHKTLRRRPRRLLNVLRTFNLRPMSVGML